MTNVPTPDVEAGIADILCDSLGIEPMECEPESHLIRDFGAESIDSLDIVFRVEKAFDIKMMREEWMEGVFGAVVKEGESWDVLGDNRKIKVPWTTAPGTVGRMQELVRKKLSEKKPE